MGRKEEWKLRERPTYDEKTVFEGYIPITETTIYHYFVKRIQKGILLITSLKKQFLENIPGNYLKAHQHLRNLES